MACQEQMAWTAEMASQGHPEHQLVFILYSLVPFTLDFFYLRVCVCVCVCVYELQ